jgi:hypothetical protein
MTVRAIAHAIVRRYPAAWRGRYEAEVRGLIDDASIQFRDLGELLRGLFTERAQELLTSADNPRRTATILGLMAPVAGGVFLLLAWLTGYAMRSVVGPLSDAGQYVGLSLAIVLMIVFFVMWSRGWKRRDRTAAATPGSLPPDVVVVMLPLLFVQVALFAVILSGEPDSPSLIPNWLNRVFQLFVWASIAGNLLSSLFPGHALLQAFTNVSFAERQIRSNEQWVQGCREMISKGVPSPLQDALAQVGKWTVERDSARARLKELGYEARFRGVVGRRESGRETAT